MSSEECCGVSAADCESAGTDTVEVVDLSGLCDETGRFIVAPPVGTYVWVVNDEFDGMDGFVCRWKVPYESRVNIKTNVVMVTLTNARWLCHTVSLSETPLYRDGLSALRAAHVIAMRVANEIQARIEAESK